MYSSKTTTPIARFVGALVVRIDTVRLSTTDVGSGEPLHFALACRVLDGGRPEAESVYLRVRLAETGQVAFETGTFPLGVALPASGAFQVTFDLQMNLQPGVYLVETYAWDRTLGRESCAGPSAYLEVRGAPFPGYAQCHPRVRVEQPAADGTSP